MKPINLAEKLATFTERWQPRVVGQFNAHDLMVAKIQGEFVWHKHDDTDAFSLVLSGRLRLELRDGAVSLEPGEVFVGPRGRSTDQWQKRFNVLPIERRGTLRSRDPTTGG